MAAASITVLGSPLVAALLARADDALILGHRLSEWAGHAPLLEEELAFANIALDLIGQARALYAEAGALIGQSEDELAYLRDAPQWRNALIMEVPNGDFAFSIARLLVVSAFAVPFWRVAAGSSHAAIAAIGAKAVKETEYHHRHAEAWLIRLGDGTAESHRRAQDAMDALWPYTGELLAAEAPELVASGVIPDPPTLRAAWEASVAATLARATLARPADGWMQSGGRTGRHTEHLGHLLAELQFLQRAYPGATW
ncbi:MAG TPA: 1,2-phenylacetyl-CoA epoxidase subunit PaaC [Acetobacteraceae bacterium]|nr:1,2-phenylacetyl-CoA epoxidase subunit PaaC [Acetobacteraceae bacterium]